MIDFTPEIEALERAIAVIRETINLPAKKLDEKKTKKILDELTEAIDDIYYIDDLMPLEEFGEKFTHLRERKQFYRVMELLDEAFSILEEYLGPTEEEYHEIETKPKRHLS